MNSDIGAEIAETATALVNILNYRSAYDFESHN